MTGGVEIVMRGEALTWPVSANVGEANVPPKGVACSPWLPIATAPRDGTEIMLWGDWAGEINGPSLPRCCVVGYWRDGRTDYPGYEWTVCGTDAYAAWMKPSHWMPLPEPPK